MGLTSYNLTRVRPVVDESSLERSSGAQINWAAITADADGAKRVKAGAVVSRTAAGKLQPRSYTQSITSIAALNGTATAVKVGHGYSVGERVTIAGATPAWLNGSFVVATVPDADTFTFAVSAPADLIQVTLTDAGDLVGRTAHGLPNGAAVQFQSIQSTTGIAVDTTYYVISTAADTFQVSATAGGSALTLTTNGTAVLKRVGWAASGTLTAARSASEILETDATDANNAEAYSGYSTLVGGVLWENLLPDATGTPKVVPAQYKSELVSAGCTFKFRTYADTRAS